MLSPQMILPIHKSINVDLFAGGGGASLGSEMALGRHVDIAVNHNPIALSIHKVNHPQTTHYISDVFEVDPKEAAKGLPVGFVWASPDCRHFSSAKGGVPVSDAIRGLAWVIRDWARDVRPTVIAGENVPEMLTWGPLDSKGYPDKARQGETFKEWVSALEALGYTFEYKILVAADYGAPTTRKRLYFIARCDGKPIVWPKPTHSQLVGGKPSIPNTKPWKAASSVVDFSLQCPTIFKRTKELAPATCRRIVKGIERYVLNSDQRFVVPAHRLSSSSAASLQDHRGKIAVLLAQAGDHGASKNLTEPYDVLVMANLIHLGHGEGKCGKKRFSHGIRSLDMPLNTITASGAPSALIMSYMVKLRGTNVGSSMNDPLHTISAQGTHHAEVRVFLQKWRSDAGLEPQAHDVDPEYIVLQHEGECYVLVDIGFRMLTPRELYRAQSFPDSYVIDRDESGQPITKTNQVKMVGNSVCPVVAQALIKANHPELMPNNDHLILAA